MIEVTEENKTPLIIGCDHAAYALKDKVKNYLSGSGIEVVDVGTYGPESVNYTDYAIKVASSISNGQYKRGILLCGTGLGMSMIANRFPNVRAALCTDEFTARMSRLHNDSNILVMGGRTIGEAMAMEIVKTWLETPFEGGRHKERIERFDCIILEGAEKTKN